MYSGGAGTDILSFYNDTLAALILNAAASIEQIDLNGWRWVSGTTGANLFDLTGVQSYSETPEFELGGGADTFLGSDQAEEVYGEAGNDLLNGNGGNDTLRGEAGDDTLVSSAGNDGYFGGDGQDVLEINIDTFTALRLSSSASIETVRLNGHAISGTAAANSFNLSGVKSYIGVAEFRMGDGADVFLGAARSDEVHGEAGNDLIETGAGDDTLNGDDGDDTLDGGGGTDMMLGGAGNDTYVVSAATDLVFETTTQTSGLDAGGTDTVKSTVSLSLAASTGLGFVENLTLTGNANANATGNGLINQLVGNSGRNVLDGGAGDDIMLGGAGDDTYIVDSIGDQVFETKTTTSVSNAGGTDTVKSTVSFSLAASTGLGFVENLTLTGNADIDATGNMLANKLTGNGGANVLNGGLGADLLTGGLGADIFVFDSALGGGNIDKVKDFKVALDVLHLEDAIFAGLAGGVLEATAFTANKAGAAKDAFDRVIYETDTGFLYFDADGDGTGARVKFAALSINLALSNADFFVV